MIILPSRPVLIITGLRQREQKEASDHCSPLPLPFPSQIQPLGSVGGQPSSHLLGSLPTLKSRSLVTPLH